LLQFGGWGRFYFQVTIDSLDHEFGANVAVGLDVVKSEAAVREALVPGFVGSESGVFGCCIQVDFFVPLISVVVFDNRLRTTALYTAKAHARFLQARSSRCAACPVC
jgi:hypothetical protein